MKVSRTFGHWTRILLCVFAVFVLVLAASACGDDDDSSESEPAETTAGRSEGVQALCDAAIEAETKLTSGDTNVESELQAALEAAPEEVSDTVQSIVTMLRSFVEAPNEDEGFAILESPEFIEADQNLDEWMLDNCETSTLEVRALDYEFEGIPEPSETVPAGPTAITLNNDGKEVHEIALFRVNEGEERSVEELLSLPEEEAQALVTQVAAAFAEPGQSTVTFARLDEGRYGAVCFVPVGSVPGQPEPGPDAPPHFTQGMMAEFEVTGS
jgi:hypothetical protein